MIRVTFMTVADGKSYSARLPKDFTRLDFIFSALPSINLMKQRVLINDQVLHLDNETIFNRQKDLIQNNTQILLLSKATEGTYMEISLLKQIILEELKTEWTKIDRTKCICDFCLCEEMCATIHRTHVCIDCFPNYLKETNFQLRCTKQIVDRNDLYHASHRVSSIGDDLIICKATSTSQLDDQVQKTNTPKNEIALFCEFTVDYRTFFKTTDFIDRYSILCDITDLLKNIDCQICYCGALLFNMTMYAKQQCTSCQRSFCFFCNRTWNDETMKNLKYTCTDECEYERRIQYTCVPLRYSSPTIMVPDRRCCPKCFITGGYANACKYHSCPYCRYQFCFICLETDSDCKRKYKSKPYTACTDIKQQDYSIFPRVHNS